MKATQTVGEYLLGEIKRFGVKRAYGIPGDFVIKFFKLLEDDSEMELCTFSHEQGAGFAAVGEARASRRPALAVVTYGPGLFNVINAVACAYAEKTPLVLVVGGPPLSARSNDFFLHHTVKSCSSLLEAVSQVTAEAFILDDPETAEQKVSRALTACQENMLPVYIEVPADVFSQKIGDANHPPLTVPTSQSNLKQSVESIAKKLKQAQKPVLMMGMEADRYNLKQEILTLAQKLGLPVVSTVLTRNQIHLEHPNYFGTYLGVAGNPAAGKLVEESDYVLVLGEMLSDVNLGAKLTATKQSKLDWCFSREVNADSRSYGDVTLKALVESLVKAVTEKKKLVFPAKATLKVNRACKYTDKLLVMGEVIDAVNWLFGEYGEMPVVADTGDGLFATLRIDTSTVLAPFFYGTMGFAVPAAMGYAIETKKRPLVLVGDGAFQMTGPEISHCPRYKINPIFIVINNRRWGMEQLFYPSARFNELVDWHYAELADLWGGKGYRCTNCIQLYTALKDAQTQKCFTVVEVVTERDELSDELMAWIVEQKGEK